MVINKNYLSPESQAAIKEVFRNEGKVILFGFFEKDLYKILTLEIKKLKFKREQHYLTHCYEQAALTPDLQQKFNEIIKVIGFITKTKISSWNAKILRFSWKDYTILHDENQERAGIDLIFDCTDDWNEKAGGAVTYVDGTGNYTRLLIRGNMLAIVKRDKNEQKFVQYVNHYAGKKKRYIVMGNI